ncbi:MAG: phosphoribosylanthranilate isomerase [Rickettsiales bacterium]
MHTRIKNCGLTNPESIAQSVATGANYIGFVHHIASPRHADAATIRTLFSHVPSNVARVIVLVNPDDATIESLPIPSYWQIHGATTERIADLSARYGSPVISAISVSSAHDLALAATHEEICDHLLFDAATSGSGKPFDWNLLKNLPLKKPWFLAGGLTPENVADAIRITHAPIVDVSSGIEDSPGNKSLEKIAAFNAAVLNAADAQTKHSS